MDGHRFDRWVKSLGGPESRRRVLAGLAGAGVAGLLPRLGGGEAAAQTCRGLDQPCKAGTECCSGLCSGRGRCACSGNSVPCRGGAFASCCPAGSRCFLDNPQGPCCPPGEQLCGRRCVRACPPGGQAPDPNNGCRCACLGGSIPCRGNQLTRICCPAGTGCYPDNEINTCCPPGRQLCNNRCVPACPPNTGLRPDPNDNCRCGCLDGTIPCRGINAPRICCPAGTGCFLDNPRGHCCPRGRQLCNGRCVPGCPEGSGLQPNPNANCRCGCLGGSVPCRNGGPDGPRICCPPGTGCHLDNPGSTCCSSGSLFCRRTDQPTSPGGCVRCPSGDLDPNTCTCRR